MFVLFHIKRLQYKGKRDGYILLMTSLVMHLPLIKLIDRLAVINNDN